MARRSGSRIPHRVRRRSWAVLPLVALLAVAGPVFLALAGTAGPEHPTSRAMAELERMLDRAGFGLTQVHLSGHRYTLDSDVFDAIGLAASPTVLSFDSRAAQARIERLPWVERASIERVLPDRIDVHVSERRPFALWRLGTRHYLVDADGRVLGPTRPDAMPALPRIAGEGGPEAAAGLFALLSAYPPLLARVETAERVGSRRWRLRLADGGSIELPADGVDRALAQAAALAGRQALRGHSLDLRVAARVILREGRGAGHRAGGAAEEPPAVGGT